MNNEKIVFFFQNVFKVSHLYDCIFVCEIRSAPEHNCNLTTTHTYERNILRQIL